MRRLMRRSEKGTAERYRGKGGTALYSLYRSSSRVHRHVVFGLDM